jgi:DNA-binding HxlR family transcriptional regulator
LQSEPEGVAYSRRTRPQDAAEPFVAQRIDWRFYELKEELERWCDETVRLMRIPISPIGKSMNRPELNVIGEFRQIFSKWSIEIISFLTRNERVRFEEIHRALRGISSRVLSSKLSTMEGAGIISRTFVESKPPRARYDLTERGITLARLGRPVVLFLLNERQKETLLR